MGRRHSNIHSEPGGFSLLELLLVLALLGVCVLVGAVAGAQALGARQAKGAAQGWQAAAGWAQVGVLWNGGDTELASDGGSLSLENDLHLCGGRLEGALPSAPVATNVSRWLAGTATVVTFGGRQASPDSGGSLFFGSGRVTYRVAVRPESGLTARSLAERVP
jgi:prepilin-type N-terminal cleavage/methylation domain-containing protein